MGSGPLARTWGSRASVSEAGGPGLGSSRAPSLLRAAGQRFSWPRRGFPLPAIKKTRQPFIIVTPERLSEHFRGRNRNTLGFARRRTSKLVGRAATQPNANSKSSPSRWGCFVKRFSADVVSWPLAPETRSSSLPLQHTACCLPVRLVRCLPLFATRHLLRRSRCAALSPLCLCDVPFVNLRWCGSWPLVAGLGGWE